MSLTELEIRNLKPRASRYLVSDGRGLSLAVMPSGEKYWYRRTWKDGRESKRSLGRWPEVSLKRARELHYTMDARSEDAPVIFASVAADWWAARCETVLRPRTLRLKRHYLNRRVLPALGGLDMKSLTPQDVISIIRDISARCGPFAGRRVQIIISQVFQYAIASGLVQWNPVAQISGALTPLPKSRHYSTIQTGEEAAEVLRAVDAYKGNRFARLGLLLLAYTFVRPGEMIEARWPELDFDKNEWRIPPERMKMDRPHVVPLSAQALSLFRELREISASPVWCFFAPLARAPFAPSLFTYHFRRLGYGRGRMTPHGFRGMASTLLNENGFPPDVIERQLAHVEKNAVRAAYNRAEYMDERRKMMQWWGDYVESLIKK